MHFEALGQIDNISQWKQGYQVQREFSLKVIFSNELVISDRARVLGCFYFNHELQDHRDQKIELEENR